LNPVAEVLRKLLLYFTPPPRKASEATVFCFCASLLM
jgi:hypothetical protein